jgi:uncharacterized phage protein gp47/JayE
MSTTAEIFQRIYTSIVTEIQKIDTTFNSDPLKKSVEVAISKALAPEFKLLELLNQNAAKQGNPLEAFSKEVSSIGSLESWGDVKLNRQPDPATGGTYDLTVTGNGTVTAGIQYVNQGTGFVYLVQTDTVIVGSGTVEVKSVGTGSDVALDVATELFSQTTITGIDNPATVASETTAPTAGETVEEYREDIIQAFRNTPRGGARGDYVVWADEVAGVLKGYPYTGGGLNQMTVYVQSIADPQGVTSQALLDDVQDYVESVQPATAGALTVISTIPREYDVEITNITATGLDATIQAAIDSYFEDKRPFLDGIDLESERADRIVNSEVFAVVQNAILPASFDNLQISYNSVDVPFENLPDGNIPKTGTITYV